MFFLARHSIISLKSNATEKKTLKTLNFSLKFISVLLPLIHVKKIKEHNNKKRCSKNIYHLKNIITMIHKRFEFSFISHLFRWFSCSAFFRFAHFYFLWQDSFYYMIYKYIHTLYVLCHFLNNIHLLFWLCFNFILFFFFGFFEL